METVTRSDLALRHAMERYLVERYQHYRIERMHLPSSAFDTAWTDLESILGHACDRFLGGIQPNMHTNAAIDARIAYIDRVLYGQGE